LPGAVELPVNQVPASNSYRTRRRIPDLVRDSESVLSGYFSFSTSTLHLFGDRVYDFAREVRALLASRSPENVFWTGPALSR
jgi:hypothetical protein